MSSVTTKCTMATKEVTMNGTTWVKVLDGHNDRHYLSFQNDKDSKKVEIGFGTDTVAPTGQGFQIKGSSTAGDPEVYFEFSVTPVNAVWAKSESGATHKLFVMYDD